MQRELDAGKNRSESERTSLPCTHGWDTVIVQSMISGLNSMVPKSEFCYAVSM